jgi:hypothetical protein
MKRENFIKTIFASAVVTPLITRVSAQPALVKEITLEASGISMSRDVMRFVDYTGHKVIKPSSRILFTAEGVPSNQIQRIPSELLNGIKGMFNVVYDGTTRKIAGEITMVQGDREKGSVTINVSQ